MVLNCTLFTTIDVALAKNPNAILAGAALTGLGFISLFDHYLWTLAPGRIMLGLVIGLFVGQDLNHEA